MSALAKFILVLLCLLVLGTIEAADDLESRYARFIELQLSGDYEAALEEGTAVLRFLDPPEEMVMGATIREDSFFYD